MFSLHWPSNTDITVFIDKTLHFNLLLNHPFAKTNLWNAFAKINRMLGDLHLMSTYDEFVFQ